MQKIRLKIDSPYLDYLPVWNAVYFIYSNPDESSCVHTSGRWHFRLNTDYGRHEMCPLRFLSVPSSAKNAFWMISLWSEAIWSYMSGGISWEIVNSQSRSQVRLATSDIFWNLRLLTAPGHIHENILLDKFPFLIRIDIFHTKHGTNRSKWYY